MLCLLQLVLHRLTIGRSQVVLSPSIDVEQIDKIFPALIKGQQVHGNFFTGGELFVVGINLVLHPTQILDGFTLARIETFDYRLALRLAKFARAFLGATFDQAAIKRCGRHDRKIERFRSKSQQQRRYVLKENRAHQKAGHTPKVNRLLESLF